MSPRSAPNNVVDRLCINAELASERMTGCMASPWFIEASNLTNLRFVQFPRPTALPPLFNSVSNVVGIRTQKQVRRIHAAGIVAAMQNASTVEAFSLWDRAVEELPGEAMRLDNALTLTPQAELPITLSIL